MNDKYNYGYEIDDIYCYPHTSVLKNKLNIRNDKDLYDAEMAIVAYQTADLIQKPVRGNFDFVHLKTIHARLFDKIYDWAGKERTVSIAKSNLFCLPQHIESFAREIFDKLKDEKYFISYDYDKTLDSLVKLFSDVNALHPFRDGNGRTQREFIEKLAKINGIYLDLTVVSKNDMIAASHDSIQGNNEKLKKLFLVCAKPMNKKEQFTYIDLYTTSKLKKLLLELL